MRHLSWKSGLGLPGLGLLGFTAAITYLTHSVSVDENLSRGAIALFLLFEATAFVMYFFALEWVRRSDANPSSSRVRLVWIFTVAILARTLFFFSEPIQETDPHRYIWDGQVVLTGTNPYRYSPREAYDLNLLGVRDSQTKRDVYTGINYKGVRTIYPPAAQTLFAAAQMLSPWRLEGWRVLIFLSELGILWILAWLLGSLGFKREWVLLYGWSPLILKEFANSLHLDVFAVLFLCMTLFCLKRERPTTACVFLSLAVCTKWFALMLLPAFLVWGYYSHRLHPVKGLGVFAAVMVLSYAPFMDAGMFLIEGLSVFGTHWVVNEGLYALIEWGVGLFPITDPMAVNFLSRAAAGILIALVTLVLCLHLQKKPDFVRLVGVFLGITASLFFLSPMGNPWYYTWLFPWLVFFPMRSLIVFSGLVFLYYLDFWFLISSGQTAPVGVRIVEYGVFYVLFGIEWFYKRKEILK